MPRESSNYYVPEESRHIAVRTPTGLINQENETIFYFNTTILCYTEMLFLDN